MAEIIRHSPSGGTPGFRRRITVATPWKGISVTKTHLRAWSALMALVGVVLMLGASVASAAPTARAMDPAAGAGVTVTVTPTILVSEDENGELVTVGTVTPGAEPAATTPGATTPAATTTAATTEAGSSGFLVWIVVGLALALAAGGAYWWLLLRRSTAHVGRRVKKQPDTPPRERREH